MRCNMRSFSIYWVVRDVIHGCFSFFSFYIESSVRAGDIFLSDRVTLITNMTLNLDIKSLHDVTWTPVSFVDDVTMCFTFLTVCWRFVSVVFESFATFVGIECTSDGCWALATDQTVVRNGLNNFPTAIVEEFENIFLPLNFQLLQLSRQRSLLVHLSNKTTIYNERF